MPDISIGRLRGGYCVYWTEGRKRRRYQLEARSRTEAEAEGRDRYLKETRAPGGQTVAQIWEGYIVHLGEKPTAETMRHTGKAVLAHFGSFRPDQITVQDCRDYAAKRAADGRKIGTVHTEMGHLRSALRWAHRQGIIAREPYIERPPKPASDVRPLTDAQITALLDGCRAYHVRLAVVLLLTTGARVGAVLDLEWNRIDFERGVIDLRLPDGVTRKGRAVVPMNRMARASLEHARRAALTPYVVEWAGGPVKSIRTGYRAALRRAGLRNVNIHSIRHTVAIKLLQSGAPMEEVSQYLGHSNTATTYKIYARFQPEYLAERAEVLNFHEVRRNGKSNA